jgi:quinol monooxygenase YgiN
MRVRRRDRADRAEEAAMVSVALYVPLEAKPEKADEVEKFLRDAESLAEQEPGTTAWFALRMGPTSFAIFDAFPDADARQAHLAGRIAEALMARADELLTSPPPIRQVDVIASKLPG